jgi:predicted nucleic acid-binding protein
MKPVFVDTNVLLDVLMAREPLLSSSSAVLDLIDRGIVKAGLSAISINNVFFILKKNSGSVKAYEVIETLQSLFTIVDLTSKLIKKSIEARWADFEDAIQYHSALAFKASVIISRDGKGFKNSRIPVMTPQEFLAVSIPN